MIHMETEHVYTCARALDVQSAEIEKQMRLLMVAVRSMEWYGFNRDSFQAEMEALVYQLALSIDQAQSLSIRARLAADEWQQLDSNFAQQYSYISFTIPGGGEHR